MENATKALMIAGAVLLAIMIIGVGMMIFQNAQGTIGGAASKMKQQEIDLFNNQFTNYEGLQSGSNVKALIGSIITNNSVAVEEGNEDTKTVSFNGATDSAALSSERTKIVSGKKYNVVIAYDASGLVHEITAEVSGGSSSGGSSTNK